MSNLLNFFNLASDETRLRLMILLSQNELCVCQLCGILDLSQPKVSKHLTILRDANYVTTRKEGKFIYYSLHIQNNNIMDIIHNIISNIEDYPILKEDIHRLAIKDTYFSNCSSSTKYL